MRKAVILGEMSRGARLLMTTAPSEAWVLRKFGEVPHVLPTKACNTMWRQDKIRPASVVGSTTLFVLVEKPKAENRLVEILKTVAKELRQYPWDLADTEVDKRRHELIALVESGINPPTVQPPR